MSLWSPKLTTLCAIVFGLGFAASAYLNFVQYQNSQADLKQANGTITDLRYQVGLDRAAKASPSPSASPAVLGDQATPTPTPSATPVASTTTTKAFVYLHSSPSQSSSILAQLQAGTTVTLVASANDKYEQVVYNGTTGYIAKSYLNL